MRFPLKVNFTSKCNRCGLRYPQQQATCPHCSGLTDEQVRKIKLRHKNEQVGIANMGRLLMYIAGLLVVVMVIYLLNK